MASSPQQTVFIVCFDMWDEVTELMFFVFCVCYLCDMLNSCRQSRLFSGHKSQNVGFLKAFLTPRVSTVVKIAVKAWVFGDGHNEPSNETQRNRLGEQNLSSADLPLVCPAAVKVCLMKGMPPVLSGYTMPNVLSHGHSLW